MRSIEFEKKGGFLLACVIVRGCWNVYCKVTLSGAVRVCVFVLCTM